MNVEEIVPGLFSVREDSGGGEATVVEHTRLGLRCRTHGLRRCRHKEAVELLRPPINKSGKLSCSH